MTADAFKQLILSNQPDMQRYATALLGDADAAADAVQEAVIELWQQHERLDKVVNLKGYCVTMAKRRCIDQLRQLNPTTPINEEALMVAVPPPDDIDERYRQALKLVERLPKRQRDAILLKYEQGKENKEIEQIMNMSSTHLYATLSRAYSALREMMQKQE
jgi:RNA polymerase sigma-70 factor (ECF subfamily)